MTDFSNWYDLIHQLRASERMGEKIEDVSGPLYFMLPFNDYQLGNLLGALKRSKNNGDWFNEVVSIIMMTMAKFNIKELSNNFGETITIEQLESGSWLESKQS